MGATARGFAAEWYVAKNDPNASDTAEAGRGSEAKPFRTIQAALDNAGFGAGDTVWVKPGVYDEGGKVDSESHTNRVYIAKKVFLYAKDDKSNTHIVGVRQSGNAYGCGPAAVRCVQATADAAGTILRGFTIRDGGAHISANSGVAVQYAAGGVLAAGVAIYLDRCTVRDCGGGRYAAFYSSGVAVRSLFMNNVANYAWGSCSRDAKYLNCVLFANGNGTSSTAVEYGTLVNCSLIDNYYNGIDSAATYNTILSSSNGSANDKKQPGTYTNLINTANNGFRHVMSTATGDFRLLPTSAAVNGGDAQYLTKITLPTELEAERYFDYYGNAIAREGTIHCGAAQDVATPGAGCVTLAFTTKAGDFNTVVPNAYVCTETYPTQYLVKPLVAAGQTLYGVRHDPRCGYVDGLYPDLNGYVALNPDPCAESNDTYQILTAGIVKWVDPNGSDSNDGSEALPYKTLQTAVNAVASTQRGVIFAKKGVYDEGSNAAGTYRVSFPSGMYCCMRAVDGPEKTVIRGGVGLGCVSMGYLGALHGFTLTGTDTSSSGSMAAFEGNKDFYTLTDCIISNNVAGASASVVNGGVLQRCRIEGNTFAKALVSSVRLASCSVSGNTCTGNDGYLLNGGEARQCSIGGNGGTPFYFSNGVEFRNCALSGSGAFGSGSGSGNVAFGFASVPGNGFAVADPLFVDAAGCDLRTRCGSPAVTGGDKPTAGNYAGVYTRGWTIFATSSMEGKPLCYSSTGVPTAGAWQHDHPEVVSIAVPHGGIAVSGDVGVGVNLLPKEGSVTVTLNRSLDATYYCTGFTADGVYYDFDDYPSGWTRVVAAGAGGLAVEAVYQRGFYASPAGNDANDGFTRETPKTLAGALAAALSGDTIKALFGVYAEGAAYYDANCAVKTRVIVPAGVTLEAVDGAAVTVIEGAVAPEAYADAYGCGTGAVRCVALKEGAEIRGFTLRGGRVIRTDSIGLYEHDRYGAAVYGICGKTWGRVVDCVISNCVAYRGAGAAYTTADRCRFYDCRAQTAGSAVYYGKTGSSFFSKCRGPEIITYPDSVVNCTFANDNRGWGTGDRATAVFTTADNGHIRNCLVLCSSSAASIGNRHCIFVNDAFNALIIPAANLGEGSCVTNTAALGVDAEGRPLSTASLVVDAGRADYPEGFGDLDVDGGQRVYNGTRDVGCYEYDWRGIYAAAIGGRVTVESAAPSVTTNVAGKVFIPSGTLKFTRTVIGAVRETRYTLGVNVTGNGTLTVAFDGGEPQTVPAGVSLLNLVGTGESAAFELTYEPGPDDPGGAAIESFVRHAGFLVIYR